MPEQKEAKDCGCPYCEAPAEGEAAFCAPCDVVIVECVSCGEPVRKGVDACPHCGKAPS